MTNTITIGSGDKANWVGFSDAVDYAEFSLESGAKLSFNISADDAAKFTIYSLNSKKNKKGEFTYDTGDGKIPPPVFYLNRTVNISHR